MSKISNKFYSERNEQRKDELPSTNWFVWFLPLFVICVVLGKTQSPERSSPVFDLQSSAFICVMGQCL